MFSLAHRLSTLTRKHQDEPARARAACRRFLAKARVAERASVLAQGAYATWAVALAGTSALLLADLALAPDGRTRTLGALALAIGTCGVALLAFGRALLRRPSDRWLARRVEKRYPTLDGRLLAVTTYRDRSSAAVDAIAPHVQGELSKAWALAVPSRRPRRRSGLAALASTVACAGALVGYAQLAPAQLARAVSLEDEPGAGAQARLLAVRPGRARVVEGKTLPVEVAFAGDPGDAQLLLLPPELDSRADARPIALEKVAAGRYRATLPALLDDARYQVVANGARSEAYPVELIRAPRVTQVTHRQEPPSYLGLAPRDVPGGDVDAVEGTRIVVRARCSSEPTRGKLRATWSGEGLVETIPLVAKGRALEGSFVAKHGGSYVVDYADDTGLPAKDGATFKVSVRPDLAPRAEILAPAADREIAHSGEVEVDYECRDDFGLGSVALHVVVRGAKPTKLVLPLEPGAKVARGKVTISPRKLGLLPGDSLVYYVAAEDRKEPFANRSTSAPFTIVVEEERSLREALSGIDARDDDVFRNMEGTPSGGDPEEDLARRVDALRRLERLVQREPDLDSVPGDDPLEELSAADSEDVEKALEDLDLEEDSVLQPEEQQCQNCKRIAESSGKCQRCGRVDKCGTCGLPGHGRGCFAPRDEDGQQAEKGATKQGPGAKNRSGRKGSGADRDQMGGRSYITRVSKKELVRRYRELLDRRRELLRKLADQVAKGRGVPEQLARELGPASAKILDALRAKPGAGLPEGSAARAHLEGAAGKSPTAMRALRVREEIPHDALDLRSRTEEPSANDDRPSASTRAPGWDEQLPPELKKIVRAYFKR